MPNTDNEPANTPSPIAALPRWQLWINTGGTFTDCLAQRPTGQTLRSKVLSNGTLRGKVLTATRRDTLRVLVNWNVAEDIFANYHFQLIGINHPPLNVLDWHGFRQEIQLEALPDGISPEGHDFMISTGKLRYLPPAS